MEFKSKTTQICSYVRRKIISGEYEVGKPVRLQQLAEELDVSQTPVREALRILEAEGYVMHRSHYGFQVAAPQSDRMAQIFELRELLEGYVAEQAALHITESELDHLASLLGRMEEAAEDGDDRAGRDLNFEFHQAIYQIAGVPVLPAIMNYLWASSPWDLLSAHPGRMLNSDQEHREIVEALAEQAPDEARMAAVEHVRASRDVVLNSISGPGDYSGGEKRS
jgi:DNA-binding GntR family transcriptional regulator